MGIIVLDNYQIQLSHALIMALMDNNVAVISCNDKHLPEGLMLPMHGHHAFTEKVKTQVSVSEPLRKNLWQQTVVAKIKNQAAVLTSLERNSEPLLYFAGKVRSGDPDNLEGTSGTYLLAGIILSY
jgi:CRISPR-associated protein Cas1